ncbi:MAG TPA: hypothetical protein VIM79_20675 [Niastella sp.]
MEKHKTLIALLKKLESKSDFSKVEFVDHWDGDLCAIGFKRGSRLVYLSSWNFADGVTKGYDCDFELINDSDKLNVLKEARDVSEDELIADIKAFLEI